jgi:DNA-binding response OmpR family regulator
MRVLVIEDDAMLGGALLAALSGEGMSVDWVRDGTDAEAALSDSGYAIVLLDLGLPDANGLDLLVVIASPESSVIGSNRKESARMPSGVSEKTSATNTMSKHPRSAICAAEI